MIDAHHHFYDTRSSSMGGNGETFQAFLATLLDKDEYYLPDDYYRDVVEPLQKQQGIALEASVHVECMPNHGPQEVAWVEQLIKQQQENGTEGGETSHPCIVQAIVGSCDFTRDSIQEDLVQLCQSSSTSTTSTTTSRVRGVRWILDCVGRYKPNTATHVGTTRHDGVDYLRGSKGGYDGQVMPEFERGFAMLAQYNLSFDLQCAPAQLLQAAELFARHVNIPVVIDHLGKPRTLLGPDTDNNTTTTTLNEKELHVWRTGMQAMAILPHVYVKLSMLGYAVPGWIKTPERTSLMKGLVQETIAMFGPHRCMAALNWYKNGAVSDSDFMSSVGPTPLQYVEFLASCLQEHSEAERDRVFYGTAQEFYRLY